MPNTILSNNTYTLVKTMGRRFNEPAIIDEIDAGDIPLLTLSQLYYDIYFIITVKHIEGYKVLYYKDLPLMTQISTQSINQYFTALGNKTLKPLSDEIPLHVRGEVYAWDVHSWNFHYNSIQLGAHPNAILAEEDKTDLHLYKDDLDDHTFACQHSLVSINGLFHYFDYGKSGWILLDGNKSRLKHPNKTHLNILDFTQVGSVKLKRINDTMVRPSKPGVPLSESIYIDAKESLAGKTVGIVIMGYFHLLDHTYKRVSDRLVKVNTNDIRLESLYYKAKELIDLSSLSLTDFGDDRMIGFEFYHDSIIREILTLPQSFLVIIDNPCIAVIEEKIGDIGIPKRYESGIPPLYPLRIGEGRYPAYKALKDYEKWCICVEDNIVPCQVRYQKPLETMYMIHDRIYPISGEMYASAYFVRIISDRNLKSRILDPYLEEATTDLGSLQPYMIVGSYVENTYKSDTIREYYMPDKIINVDVSDPYYIPENPFIIGPVKK